MKKIIVAILLIIVVVAVALFLNLNSAAKSAIETAGSQALGVPVKVGGLSLSLQNRSAGVNKLSVANPPGFNAENIIQAVNISATLGDVTKEIITIKNITIDGMVVAYEIGGPYGTNFDSIKNNIRSGGQASSQLSSGEKGAGGQGPEVVIQELKITNAQLIPSIGGKQQNIKLPDITINNIGSQQNPASRIQVASQVMNKIMQTSSVAMIQSGFSDGAVKIREGLKSLF